MLYKVARRVKLDCKHALKGIKIIYMEKYFDTHFTCLENGMRPEFL